MDKKNIFEKAKHDKKKTWYYVLMTTCVVVIATISFISYKSIQNSLSNRKIETSPETVDKVDTEIDDVSKTETDTVQTDDSVSADTTYETAPAPIETKAYIMPLEGGEITTSFSLTVPAYSKTLKDWRIHDGIDISASNEQNVLCVNDGAIESISSHDLYGITVTVKHTDGKKSVYCNLIDDIELEEGQVINQGDIIGKVGKSAMFEIADGPHLHFEMSENGKKIDPLSVIKVQE